MLKGRRIIFVLGNLELGGAERQALLLARYLSKHEKAEVEVWGFNKHGPVAGLCEQHGFAARVVPYSGNALGVGLMLRQAKPDLLLPYTWVPNAVCGLVWRWTGARSCVWNQRDEGIVPATSGWERWAVKQTPQFISNSEAGARFLTGKLGVRAERVTVIRNGIESGRPELDRVAWRARLAVDDGCFVACMVANLHANKDHETLLRAWRKVASELEASGRRALLVLAGRKDGAYESLTALATELDLDGRVRFAGQVSDVYGLLGAVDLSVFSSRSEGCPNAVLESMAAGLAVAGTDVEGIREVVGPTGAPFLAPAGDADALAGILLKMANDPGLRRRIGLENRHRVREKFDSLRMCKETVAVLARSTAD